MTKEEELEKLINKLEQDAKKLPLASKKTDIVPPEGNPEAQLMFIGEAAGFHEHRLRRPFVGLAGKLLTKSLEEVGLKREKVWISNILKVRPPQNRDPLPEEIQAYQPYLDEEIRIIEPKVIVTLGRFSMAKFIENAYISQIHGQARWVNWKEKRLLIFPMYHPAAALRNGQVMTQFKNDFTKLAKILETLSGQQQEAHILQGEEEAGEEPSGDEKNQQLSLI
ncbi:MAG: hypothetical protein A2785_00045 [Candidatus Chisholmbacteria bacterium RIFCSPHIGHO2_01_FULL_49_18]|uniref:Type-4 uracil-DNA glycosylase n=1 Tax=Candidatus Chisholmbacteria bacterium RIFCSPHIGHO2_01_FULL_49_18 TaxID=1797590 RepID=A0A1G1VLQ9_9BACT|nr:MAG: hypothetical protein A2785_00045 [Candidatus Chisholmbacteria bacterium RIFCSPHIGHO2_01_FULL_49_18]